MKEVLIFFFIYGLFGWILDTSYRSIQAKRFNQGSFLNLPFCTSYGLGGLFLITISDWITEFDLITQFVILAISLAALEYALGFISHLTWKKRYWDYRKAKFNIKGYTDLEHAIYWGLLGLFFIHILHPWVSSFF